MNILITNDDGISAPGINTLYKVLSNSHTVFMIAPNEERSGCSSAITLRNPLKVESLSSNKFAVYGFPVDCVNIGINGEIIPKIDLVISGINNGPNLGDDVYFSGTVAGARAAYIFGITGISISMDCLRNSNYYRDAAKFLLNFIDNLNEFTEDKTVCFNINYPEISKDKINGVKYTFLGKREYNDIYKIVHRSDYHMSLLLDGTISSFDTDGSDIAEVKKGHISITPMTLDSTDYTFLNKLQNMKNYS